ncbi:hypothetical protein ACPPVQ_04350 [Diaminobutyricibacter sp. McL0618]|uniref:hypothetical protein n=1 Tax=Leifsonia sp. McL0618 TaxID=3415677 RepID=UPI003CECE10B
MVTDRPGLAQEPGVLGNERLTALAGAVILVLSVIEMITVAALHSLMAAHIVVGTLLAGPVIVKLASTGWRFVRYYTHAPAYRRKGPPRLLPRVLAPVLVASTLGVIGSGIALAITGPAPRALIVIHVLSFLVWMVTLAIHLVAYLPRALRLIADDLSRRPTPPGVPGRNTRLSATFGGLAIGAVGAALLVPAIPAWTAWGAADGTKFLIVAAIAALIGAALARFSRAKEG